MKKMLAALLVCAFTFILPSGCVTQFGICNTACAGTNIHRQAQNLQKLAKVWGFAKYTHPVFLAGEKNWDEELLALMPVIRFAPENTVNDILYEWFINLGDDGYDNPGSLYVTARTIEFDNLSEQDILDIRDLLTQTPWISLIGGARELDHFSYTFRVDKSYWPLLQELSQDFTWLNSLTEMEMIVMADMGWIADESYLGDGLSAILSRFHSLPLERGRNTPVTFTDRGTADFSNENFYRQMDYNDDGYRLLGLFRLWNAMEYYYPNINMIDGDWNETLLEHISEMLEGTGEQSYLLTLLSLASRLRDGHVFFAKNNANILHSVFINEYGRYVVPVNLIEAEGRPVVQQTMRRPGGEQGPLIQGDVILRLNGIDIDDIIEDMLQYISYPTEAKALAFLLWRSTILRSHSDIMEIDILRGDEEHRFVAEGIYGGAFTTQAFQLLNSQILPENIGYINPAALVEGDLDRLMARFADTDGLIVDLRRRPSQSIQFYLADYLIEEFKPFFTLSFPSQSAPGAFNFMGTQYSGGKFYNPDAYFYDKNVALLMDENTLSFPETVIMSLRNGPNVTVMGSNSAGSNGDVTNLPLPGGIMMFFTGLGVYTVEGEQTHREGLSPDIYIRRTVEGIREGRDELMEAAIQFLLDTKGGGWDKHD
ncbi:MAG: S41 family peptidase [Defluviitaleaceae bacterium]|nr:S41 family peptidase [Defluviitaleaceae bacterium]